MVPAQKSEIPGHLQQEIKAEIENNDTYDNPGSVAEIAVEGVDLFPNPPKKPIDCCCCVPLREVWCTYFRVFMCAFRVYFYFQDFVGRTRDVTFF